MTVTIAHDIRQERQRLVATLRAVGPHAATLIHRWNAADLASHVATQDRLRGYPAYLARTTASLAGLRLSSLYLDRPRASALVNGRTKAWSKSLEMLSRQPPDSVLRARVAPITLWEHFIHHEDVRRPNDADRHDAPDLEPVLDWILQYNARRLTRGVRIVTSSTTREAGPAELITITGPLSEVVLWLSGRDTTGIGFDAPAPAVEELRARLKV